MDGRNPAMVSDDSSKYQPAPKFPLLQPTFPCEFQATPRKCEPKNKKPPDRSQTPGTTWAPGPRQSAPEVWIEQLDDSPLARNTPKGVAIDGKRMDHLEAKGDKVNMAKEWT